MFDKSDLKPDFNITFKIDKANSSLELKKALLKKLKKILSDTPSDKVFFASYDKDNTIYSLYIGSTASFFLGKTLNPFKFFEGGNNLFLSIKTFFGIPKLTVITDSDEWSVENRSNLFKKDFDEIIKIVSKLKNKQINELGNPYVDIQSKILP